MKPHDQGRGKPMKMRVSSTEEESCQLRTRQTGNQRQIVTAIMTARLHKTAKAERVVLEAQLREL